MPCGGGRGCDGADLRRLVIVPFVRGQYECGTVIFVNTSHSSGMKTLQLGNIAVLVGINCLVQLWWCVSICVPIYPSNYLYIRVVVQDLTDRPEANGGVKMAEFSRLRHGMSWWVARYAAV